ncbi:hypothetical protein IV203_037772 [Nitzschia inconspicua]|uniref:Uncharacterized protein n=1 Tax=Nitzschia inconspicua TaxID=303405 RepID=A0A9K3PZA2_9STRA|nr:hypothetical protein IV203_037772 [Nitzschia inconspicua]
MTTDPRISRRAITTSQLVALSYTYRIVLWILFAGPLLMLATQLIYMLSFFFLDAITNQHTIVTLLATAATSYKIQNQIVKAAPTEAQANETAKKLQYWLPAMMLFPCILFVRYIVTPVERVLQVKTMSILSLPIVPFAVTLQVAIGSVLLGCSICARYIGPPSIVRCSSSPLAMHPVAATIRSVTTNKEALLRVLAGKSQDTAVDKKGDQTPPPRRFQWPKLRYGFSQMIITIVFSIAATFTSVLPLTHDGIHGDTPMKNAIITVAIVTNLAHLFQATLDGTSHELNPLRHGIKSGWEAKFWSVSDSYFRSFWAPGIVILVVSYFGTTDWKDMLICILTAIVMTVHAIVFDSILKASLCATPPDIMKSIEVSASDGSPEVFLCVVLQSLCHSNNELAKNLSNISTTAIWLDLEKEEKKRNELAISTMATALLYKSPLDESGPHLEEDVLRYALVSSIGSWSCDGGVEEWKSLKEPYFVPICRGLCAYFGGLGEALVQCTSDKQSLSDQWLLPPGSVVVAECSVQGATHCLLSAISSNISTWRNSHLATLVPALLTSLFRLETGMLRYAQKIGQIPPKDVPESEKISLFRNYCPQLLALFSMVNRCSRNILQKISQETRRSEVLACCDREMLQWCDAKLDSIEHPG